MAARAALESCADCGIPHPESQCTLHIRGGGERRKFKVTEKPDEQGVVNFELEDLELQPWPEQYVWSVREQLHGKDVSDGSNVSFAVLSPERRAQLLAAIEPTGNDAFDRILCAQVLMHHGLAADVLIELEEPFDEEQLGPRSGRPPSTNALACWRRLIST